MKGYKLLKANILLNQFHINAVHKVFMGGNTSSYVIFKINQVDSLLSKLTSDYCKYNFNEKKFGIFLPSIIYFTFPCRKTFGLTNLGLYNSQILVLQCLTLSSQAYLAWVTEKSLQNPENQI